ncbi:Protein of unknown function [Singulisphaera sp. GP187]|uniref:DUF2500 domain-containing protein n=1 Tax=Singulisphaera sp. GP187 TaxID=1882752 RepID=UPI0009267CC7|nr:DUF2500 domain-containing protein [Singulisphaera sp. GP187]SIO22692.1 Protein of unknown function [Singulisphaera sp. GP187]
MDPFVLVPLFIGAVFVLVIGTIAYQAVTGLAEWSRNNSLPVQAVPARIVAKRSDVRGGMSHSHSHMHSHGRVRTYYFTTFEMKSGERVEFGISDAEYGLLVEGDEGVLTYQGTRYHGFDRRPLRVTE